MKKIEFIHTNNEIHVYAEVNNIYTGNKMGKKYYGKIVSRKIQGETHKVFVKSFFIPIIRMKYMKEIVEHIEK